MLPESFYLLTPGIYVFRLPIGSPSNLRLIRLPDGGEPTAQIQSLTNNGTLLQSPSDYIVMQILGASARIGVEDVNNDVHCSAHRVFVERIDRIPTQPVQPAFAVPHTGVSIIGHISNTGDQVALPGGMMGNTHATASITGLQLVWPDRPVGVDIAYRLKLEGQQQLSFVTSGNFCGSRMPDMRATAVEFELVGEGHDDYVLVGTAFFSGGFQVPIDLGIKEGPSGLEHLSALKLSVKERFCL